jgi:nicotinamide mononucleotide transporter
MLVEWLFSHWLEIAGALLGFISIYLQIKQHNWYWPVSIVMVSMYAVVYYQSKFYADMSLQFYFFAVGVYGWYYWLSGKKNKENDSLRKVPVVSLKLKGWIGAIVATIFFYFFIAFILIRYTDSDIAYGDAFTTAFSFVATFLLARKFIENWLFWIIADVVSVALYIYKGLYPTAILFFVLSILAVYGYFEWKKELK